MPEPLQSIGCQLNLSLSLKQVELTEKHRQHENKEHSPPSQGHVLGSVIVHGPKDIVILEQLCESE